MRLEYPPDRRLRRPGPSACVYRRLEELIRRRAVARILFSRRRSARPSTLRRRAISCSRQPRHRPSRRGSVGGVPADHPSEQRCRVGHRSRHRPAVSCVCEIGMIPRRLTNPTVGLIPTTIRSRRAHDRSVRLRADASGGEGSRLSRRWCRARSARVSIEGMRVAHLTAPPAPAARRLRGSKVGPLAQIRLAMMTTPAARSCLTTNASRAAMDPSSAREPAVVVIRSAVSICPLMTIGIPCRGPREPFDFRSASSASAIASASGLVSLIERNAGPPRSVRRCVSGRARPVAWRCIDPPPFRPGAGRSSLPSNSKALDACCCAKRRETDSHAQQGKGSSHDARQPSTAR